MKKSRSVVGFIVVLIFVVAACATTAKYEKMLRSWRGSDVNALIEAWGPPADVYVMPNGRKMYTWLWNGGTRTFAKHNQYTNTTTAVSVSRWCKTTFVTNPSGVIEGDRWQGNACKIK